MIRDLLVLYGSQTGTAQEIAERVGREGRRLHFNVQVCSFDDFPLNLLPTKQLVVYVTSTTGQGEEPDNMKKSWRMLLRKNLPTASLSNQMFGVLGLGDSSYPKFNLVAKKLNKRLIQLGGIQLLNVGLGDDQHDLGSDYVVDTWLDQLWQVALQAFPLPPGIKPISKDLLPQPKYKVFWADELKDELKDDLKEKETEKTNVTSRAEHGCILYSQQNPFKSPVVSCDRVTPDNHFQDVRLLSLDISGSGIQYNPGDIALVQPENLEDNIEFFFSLFPDLDKERLFYLKSQDSSSSIPPASVLPRPCSILQAVRSYFDIQSIPRRYFFELLAHFTSDTLEKEKFMEFNTAEGQQDLYEYCNRPRRHILEVLYDFRHTTPNIPFQFLFDLIPQIKPRSFSISSSLEKHANQIQLLVAVVKYRSNLASPRRGLCSTWISELKPGSKVNLWVRTGTIRFPVDPGTPAVMVGPGTGVAPFRSYISSMVAKKDERPMLLFFGCRNKSADYFFSDEWPECGKHFEAITAFSRDQEDKIYVQHKIRESQEKIRQLILEKSGNFFVAGNSKNMPSQVREALVDALAVELGSEEAEKYVEKMEVTGRYQTETWA